MKRAVAVPSTGAYKPAFAAQAAAREREDPELRRLREEAWARFESNGFPTTRNEDWRKTNLAPLERTRHEPASAPDEEAIEWAQAVVDAVRLPDEAARYVLVDGHVSRVLSTSEEHDGIHVRPVRNAGPKIGELMPVEGPEWAMSDLNTALFSDGLHVAVDKGVALQGLLHIVHVSTGPDAPAFVAPRHFVTLGANSRLTVVETYAGLEGASVFTNAVTEADIGTGARLRRVKIQREPLTTTHVGLFSARIGRDAMLEDVSFSIGAVLSRHDIHAALSGPGAHVTLNGVFLGRDHQHVDHRTVIEHVLHDGTSRQSYRGVVDDEAHGVFTGKIVVRPGAQRTDADQQNRNLILSRSALVDSTPQLEIHADDVKCAHGSAIGQLDEAQLFYLRTRGIPDWDARLMLTEAFAREPLAVVGEDGLRGVLAGFVTDWFIAGHPDANPAKRHAASLSDPLRVPTAMGPRPGTRKTV